MTKHTFKLSDVTGDTRELARMALGYDWNYLADAETFLFGSTDETAFRMQNVTPGTGISTGTGTIYKANVEVAGDLITTTILLDLTGLSSNTALDIIGKEATANCHLGQITAALNGTIFAGQMTCLEVPTTGDPDIDVYSSTVATGTEDVVITDSALATEAALLVSAGDWTLAQTKAFSAYPAADTYLYIVNGGGTTDGVYDAGIYKIELYGQPA
jgi:hypothetical protein